MARYDRIARLDPPLRSQAFPGWLTLRDLERREREPELGRRARLRFLALRPVLRLLAQGVDDVDAISFERQLDSVREELGHLPPRDPERARIAEYLREISGRTPTGIARATMGVGGAAEAAGHHHAAEEFYRTALDVAEAHGLAAERLQTLRRVARVQRNRGETEDALATLEHAAAIAEASGNLVEWGRALDGMAAVRLRIGDAARAREALTRVDERGRAVRDDGVRAVAAAGRCALELAVGSAEAAIEAGWEAIDRMDPDDEDRNGVLLNMGAAFRRLGLRTAAESCYRIIERWAAWPEHRLEAQIERAAVAAEAGDVEGFREREESIVAATDRADAQTAALAALGLGRGALLLGEVEGARTHLRRAIDLARDAGGSAVLLEAGALLDSLERNAAEAAAPPAGDPSDGSRSIARRVEALSRELAPAR